MSFMDAQRMSKTMHQAPYTVTIAANAAVSSQVIIENTFMLGVLAENAARWEAKDA